MARPRSTLTSLLDQEGVALPSPAQVMTATIDLAEPRGRAAAGDPT